MSEPGFESKEASWQVLRDWTEDDSEVPCVARAHLEGVLHREVTEHSTLGFPNRASVEEQKQRLKQEPEKGRGVGFHWGGCGGASFIGAPAQ